MNRTLELFVLGLGGLSLFVVAFLGFAAMSGVPMSKVAVVGELFEREVRVPADETEAESVSEYGASKQVFTTTQQVVEANMGLLGAYALEPPFSAAELQALAVELKSSKVRYEERLKALGERERALNEREELVSHQFQTLDELRQELERYQIELNARASELDTGDGAVKVAGPAPVLDNVARLFEVGDPEELRDRLLAYSATEAARILSNLDGERAAELLNALPDDKWKEYVDAFSSYSAGE